MKIGLDLSYTFHGVCAVSYTHLDVYKRQVGVRDREEGIYIRVKVKMIIDQMQI